jgi:hypothetical protein
MPAVTLNQGAEDNPLALLVQGVLSDCAARHGGRLGGLHSRLGLRARDADASVTLVLGDERCEVLSGLVEPDLVFEADSDLLPRLATLPTVFGWPILASPAGLELVLTLMQRPLMVRGVGGLLENPRRGARAMLDALQLTRLLAGGA